MAKKYDGYTPMGPLAAGLGLAAASLAAGNPVTSPAAATIGTMVAGFASGITLTDEEKNIKEKFDEAMKRTWHQIFVKYGLTDKCLLELQQDVIGGETSTEEFVSNLSRRNFEESLTSVIQTILKRHRDDLKIYSEHSWDDDYIDNASKDIASRLVNTLKNVFDEEDLIKILKSLFDRVDVIRSDISRNREAERNEHEKIIEQIQELKNLLAGTSFASTAFPAGVAGGQARINLPKVREEAMVPISCNYFVAGQQRSADLINIHNLIQNSRHALWIYGEGGIGKTQLLLRFAEVYQEFEYLFIQFKGSIDQTLSQNIFYLPGYEMGGIELTDIVRYQKNLSVITQYCDQLERESRKFVIIIDNYDCSNYEKTFREMTELKIDNAFSGEENDLKTIQLLLNTGARVVIATRSTPESCGSYPTYELKKMEELDLLKVITGCFPRITAYLDNPETRNKLIEIIQTAKSNTVFIAIIASAMQSSNLGPLQALDGMLKGLRSEQVYYTDYSGGSASLRYHMESVLKFMGLSYQNKHFLGVTTMIPSVGIDKHLFMRITETGAVQMDRERQSFIERLIHNHILIQESYQDPKNPAITNSVIKMHPLVSDHAQWVLSNNNKKAFYNLIYQSWVRKLLYYFDDEKLNSITIKDNDYKYLLQIAELCSFTESKLEALREYFGDQFEEKIIYLQRRLLETAAALSLKALSVKDAVEYAERLINVEGPSHEDMDSLRQLSHKLANLFWRGGKYSLAKHYFSITLQLLNDRNGIYIADSYDLDINEIIETEDAHLYGTVLNGLALVFDDQGDYDRALEYFRKALEIQERVLGTGHPDTALTYNNIAGVYKAQGDYGRALEYYRKALEIQERVLGTGHPYTAVTYNNIAGVYSDQGDYNRALEYFRKALEIQERVLGTGHPDTAVTYNNMALLYSDQGDYDRALEYYRKALEIKERVLGTGHPDTALAYNNMAGVFHVQGDYDRALEYYRKALEIQERVLGTGHPDTALTYNNIAGVYEDQGDYDRALEYYRKALEIRERVLGTGHPDTALTYNNMALVYSDQGNYDRALEYYRKALEINERVLGTGHPDTALTYNNMALVYSDQGDYDRAPEYCRKALEIRERVLGTGHPDTATSYNNMAGMYSDQGDYDRALEYYRKALEIRERVLGTGHPDTALTYSNMAAVYEDQGDYGRALEYFRKALEIRERVFGTGHPKTEKVKKKIELIKQR